MIGFTISDVISDLKDYCVEVCTDSMGFYTPSKFVYDTLPFYFISYKYPSVTCAEACQIVEILRGIYKDDNTDYSSVDDELPFD